MKTIIALLLCFPAMSMAAEPPLQWTPEVMITGATVSNVSVSPDGHKTAYTHTEAVMTEDVSAFRSTIYVASDDTSNQRRYTFGEQSATNPRWSPDGRWLAYTATPPKGKSNLVIIPSDGGGPRVLTDVRSGVGDFRWSPDSTAIAYLLPDEKSEEKEARDKAKDDPIELDTDYTYQHIWMVKLPGDREKQDSSRLTTGNYHVNHAFGPGFDWSPDGKFIAFSHTKTPDNNDWPTGDISIVDVATLEVMPFQQSDSAESTPIYAPDGKSIAFSISNFPPSYIFQTRIGVASTDGQKLKLLARTPDESPQLIGWLNRNTLLFAEGTHTTTGLFRLPLNGGDPKRFDDGKRVIGSARLNVTRSHVGLTLMDSESPQEAFVTGLRNYSPQQVSASNTHLPDLPLGNTEVIHWTSTDDLEIEGLLTYPVGYEAGTRHPLLLVIHGGPAGYFTQSFTAHSRSLYPLASFAAQGYALLRVNPRGSGGYGHTFRNANINDWGGGDFQDLMTGVDQVIDLGIADPDRLGVMGWSYGGFMTSWVITHTDRFRAASIGAPVTDLIAFNGTADILDFLPHYFGGDFWEREAVYREHSPLMHVENANTPSLIQHGRADARVPLGQGTAFYRALKRRGVETRMVTYPRSPHGPREPRQVLHVMKDNLAWFKTHIPVN